MDNNMEKKHMSGTLVRIGALLLCAAMALPLASCSFIKLNKDKFGGETSAEAAGTEAPETKDNETTKEPEPFVPPVEYEYTGKATAEARLSKINFSFGGESVFIRSTSEAGLSRIFSFSGEDADSEDTFSAAKYERVKMVEDKLSCELRWVATTLDGMKADIKATIASGDYYADLLAITATDAYALINEGYLMNLHSLPFFTTDEEYFHPATGALASGRAAWLVASAVTVEPDDVPCVFYDRGKLGGKVDELVNAGSWTWASMTELAAGGGVSIYTADAAEDGAAILDRSWLEQLVSSSAELSFVSAAPGAAAEATLPEGSALAAAVELLRGLIAPGSLIPSNGSDAFAEGKSVFHIGWLGEMNALANSRVDWDIAPMPKVTGQEAAYHAAMPASSLFLAVPGTTTNPEGASALLRALAAASDAYLIDAYAEYHMYNTVHSEATVGKIAEIYGAASYDMAHVFGYPSADIKDGTYGILSSLVDDPSADAAKLFSKEKTPATRALAKLFPTG